MADAEMRDAPERQATDEELQPHNHGTTFPFSDLFTTLFNPLNDNKKRPSGPPVSRKRKGPDYAGSSPQEIRRRIIERFIARWRKEVGPDIYPAFRLIIPEKDRERAMYGLKEKTIGKLLVQIVKIDKNSEDGYNLLNWKLPGKFRTSSMAGDFAGRCYDVLSKRAMRSTPGDMTIEHVNERLDQLSQATKEEEQMPIMQNFYQHMNAEELMWLIRIILRQMKIGATERTIFNIWHPDAEILYSVSSSLKRVCWELADPNVRLAGDQTDIKPLECFQPQLAQFQAHSLEKMVQRLHPTQEDREFWIEEKLDGERMQLHMVEDESLPGGRRFRFWSRKAKDYTDMYGTHLEQQDSALTQHLKKSFDLSEVRNIILDGEMITWDTEMDAIVPFGTLKTATIEQKSNPFARQRPLFRIFDILYLNDTPLLQWTLRDRRRALERAVKPVHRRMEIHDYTPATEIREIEDLLRKVILDGAEGLVVKNPRSMYRLNERNDDWVKVKPEYMTEFGESLDCVVIGGYYGTGRRGGNISSYLCGLLQDDFEKAQDDVTCSSLFKVGGGFTAADYQTMRHHTDGKWRNWDKANPPPTIKLGGGVTKQYERPDVWIRPEDSVVIEAKAASVGISDQFALGLTLRFPRFKRIRDDKSWREALTVRQFMDLRRQAEQEHKDKQFTVDDGRKRARLAQKRKPLVVAGAHDSSLFAAQNESSDVDKHLSSLFAGMTFHIMSESLAPSPKHTKSFLEGLVKAHGGAFTQNRSGEDTICVADRNLTSVASLKKQEIKTILKTTWLFDCIAQARVDIAAGYDPLLLPWELGRHTFFVRDRDLDRVEESSDAHGDSFARDVGLLDQDTSTNEMRDLLDSMPDKFEQGESSTSDVVQELLQQDGSSDGLRGWLFRSCVIAFEGTDIDVELAATRLAFGGGRLGLGVHDAAVTHIVVSAAVSEDRERLREIREVLTARSSRRIAKIVGPGWISESWQAETLVDEDRFVVT